MAITNLTDEKKGVMFRMLAEKSLYETGVEFGLDKHYKDAAGVKNRMQRIYNEVRANPDRYFVSQDLVDTIAGIMANRNVTKKSTQVTLREKREMAEADDHDVTKLVLSGRGKAFRLLHKKLDSVGRNKKSLETVSLPQLATVAAILFDKGQIVQGQATENIAVLAKIDNNMTPEEMLAATLRMREGNIIAKEAKAEADKK